MSKQQVITGKVTNNIAVLLKSVNDATALNQPLYAINWFSTKIEWMYHFYNFLAYPRVKSVGGKVFFKGKLYQTLYGKQEDARELLLIVNYPSGNHFKNLMMDTLFKMVSIFRILAVKKFSFGFTQKLFPIDEKTTTDKTKKYAIHHFKTPQLTEDKIRKLKEILEIAQVRLHYAGAINALLYSQETNKEVEQIPCLMNGIFLLESDTEANLKDLVNKESYQNYMKHFDTSFIGLIERSR